MKKVVFYHPHRQVTPLIGILRSKGYLCFNANLLWSTIPIKSSSIWKFRIGALILKIFCPSYILTCNWISRIDTFYYLWSKKYRECKYIVIQHGGYVGGMVTMPSHLYVKCSQFLVWSDYYKSLFESYNFNRKEDITVFGNPAYVNYPSRQSLKYINSLTIKCVLIVNSGVTLLGEKKLRGLVNTLNSLGIQILVKWHNHQERKFGKIEGYEVENDNLYTVLQEQRYDLIICDHGTSLLDAIYFKNRVLFCPQEDRGEVFIRNKYSDYLKPLLAKDINSLTIANMLNNYFNLVQQESLLNELVKVRDGNEFPFQ